MDIGKGDWVECVGDWPLLGLTAKSVWLCDGVEIIPENRPCLRCGGLSQDIGSIALRGWSPPSFGGSLACPCGFRPLYRPKGKELERQLLEKPTEDAQVNELIAALQGVVKVVGVLK